MLYWIHSLLPPDLAEKLRLVRYITFRSGLALMVAFLLSLLIGGRVIEWLRNLGIGQNVRKITKEGAPDLYAMHSAKQGTPTMGGVLIAVTLFVSVLLFARWDNPLVIVCICVIFGFGVIGFLDDFLKVTKRNHRGLSAKVKLGGQILVGLCLGLYLQNAHLGIQYQPTKAISIGGNTFLTVPFFKTVYPNLGWLFLPFVILVVTAASNAVNLTDGLDGLASGCAVINAIAFAVVAYLAGNIKYAPYLLIPWVPDAGELTVILSALIGAVLGFLWFNAHPAMVFMGDIGSLTIGGLLGCVAVMVRQEILLVIIGGIFVMEALSVIIQVGSYKLRGKRVFLMSPLHHHFEKLGWDETRIVVRFWIIAALLALVGLGTLKLR